MGFFDLFKKNTRPAGPFASGSYVDTDINDDDLKVLISQSVAVFMGNPGYDANQIIDGIMIFRKEDDLAVALYRFIPLAFCKVSFPEPVYAETFALVKGEKTLSTHSFSDDRIFQLVMEDAKRRMALNIDQEKLLNILFHSAEFDALNQALSAGSNLGDLEFTTILYPV